LLLFAACGAATFAASDGFVPLVLGRALVGLGAAGAMMAGLKAIIIWFPKERLPLLNGCFVMLGALGGVTATAPAELLIAWTGWRGLFEILAAATAGCAVLIYFAVPESTSAAPAPKRAASISLRTVYADLRFWRLAAVSATSTGTVFALQGLWAASWLTDVEGMERSAVVRHLFVMALAQCVGALLMGIGADRLRRRGVQPETLFSVAAALLIATLLGLVLRLPVETHLIWAAVAAVGATTGLGFAILAEYFPKELAGRANAALGVFHIGGAFVIQYSIGLVVQQWTGHTGEYPAVAYQTAFALNLALSIAALGWFVLPRVRAGGPILASATLHLSSCPESATSYQKAAYLLAERLGAARSQASNWRLAALGSTSLSALLGLALAISAARASVAPYVVRVDPVDEARVIGAPIKPHAPSDAQIAYFLARFIKNVRSLSTDPIMVRANWMDALNYVTGREARTLDDHARDADPFTKIGTQPITVDVIYVVRASGDSFEIRWKEQTYENGVILKTERFTGVAAITFKAPQSVETLKKNPLGLHVSAFNWSRDLIADGSK
jgi:type IV secretory pathway TrbF-like protein/predicted MFS family arabinose efflux permease